MNKLQEEIEKELSLTNPDASKLEDFIYLLQEKLNKAEKVIEYYAQLENWDFEEILDDLEFCEDPQAELGGRRARKYLFDKV